MAYNTDFSNNVENDSKKAKNTAKSAGKTGKKIAKKSAKIAKKTWQVLPPKVKIILGIVLGIILAISVLVGGTGGIYSNENTHIYTNQLDKNFPILSDISPNEKRKDTYKKDDAIKAMNKYISIIHEKIEEEKTNDIHSVIDDKIAENNWDREETYAQVDDQSDFSQGVSLSGDSNNDTGDLISSEDGDYIVKKAREYIGPKYVSGGTKIGKHGHNACDCSGFTMSLYKKYANVELPRSAIDQGNKGKTIGHSKKDLKKALPGDLLIYGKGSHHVGIFSGKKKGKYYQVHCTVWSKSKNGVMETALHRAGDITKIVRVLKSNGSSIGEKAVAIAIKHKGKIKYYRHSDKTWKQTDCGGMIYLAYKEVGVKIPQKGNTNPLKKFGTSIGKDYSKAIPGDIIVQPLPEAPNSKYRHVALYIGNNKKIEVVKKGGGRIRIAKVNKKKTLDIRRIEGNKKGNTNDSTVLYSNNNSKKNNITWKKLGKLDVTYYCKYCAVNGDKDARDGKLQKGDVAIPKKYLKKAPIGNSYVKIGKNGKKIYAVNDTGSTNSVDIFLKSKDGKCHCNDSKHGRKKNKTIYYSTDSSISINSKGELEDTEKTGFTTKLKKTVKIPKSVRQTGIIDDFTAYYGRHIDKSYNTWQWAEPCRTVANKWKKKGSKSKRKIATINGFYLVAVKPKFGHVGDAISIYLKGNKRINCIIADTKGADANSEWGHPKEHGCISIVEWESVAFGDNLNGWRGKHVTKIENYGKFNGVDINDGDYYNSSDNDITIENVKVLSAYSVSLANLQMYEKQGKIKKVASNVGYRMTNFKTYKLVDENNKEIDVKINKSTGAIEFEKDLEEKLDKYISDCHDNNKAAFFDISFQKDSNGNTTHTKTETLEIPIKNKDGTDGTKTIERTKKYGVPIVKNLDISKICLPMFKVEPDEKYVNGPSITNADAIIQLTKNTVAIYFDGDPDQVDGISDVIENNLQNAYEWPAPKSKSKKKYKLKKKTLIFKGKEGDPVVAIGKGTIESVTVDKDAMVKKVNTTENNTLDLNMQSSVKTETPKIVVISHEKGKIKSIYKGVMISGGIQKKLKVKKGQQIGTFSASGKLVFQIKVNKKYVDPLQFLKSIGTGKLMWPCSSGWSWGRGWGLWTNTSEQSHIHQGIDITASGGAGAPVLAMDNGIVVTPLTFTTYRGWYLVVKHNNKLYTEYQHLSPKSKGIVKKGQMVRKGQKIAKQGNSYKVRGNGNSDITDSTSVCGIHIHFEVYPKYPVRGGRIPWETSNKGETYDPLKFLPKSNKVPSNYRNNIGKYKH